MKKMTSLFGGTMFERIIKLIGEDNLKKIQSKTVCVVGLGGVGGYAIEGLVRSGIEKFIIVDFDKIDISNLNRQIITNKDNISMLKTDETEKRLKQINPNCTVIKINMKLDSNNINTLFSHHFDYLIDACDTIVVKEELIRICIEKGIDFISSMGTGNKLYPSKLEVMDIKKTSYDPIAKKIRKYLKDNRIKGKVMVVCSSEQREKFQGTIPSMMFVPATSGILCANYIINTIISTN